MGAPACPGSAFVVCAPNAAPSTSTNPTSTAERKPLNSGFMTSPPAGDFHALNAKVPHCLDVSIRRFGNDWEVYFHQAAESARPGGPETILLALASA